MVFKDYYKILGLESNKVTSDEIKIAYREMAKKYHPDMNVGSSQAEEIFKDVNEAYKTLSNSKLRRKYDFTWNRYFGKASRSSEKRKKKSLKEILLDILFLGIYQYIIPTFYAFLWNCSFCFYVISNLII